MSKTFSTFLLVALYMLIHLCEAQKREQEKLALATHVYLFSINDTC